MSPVTKSIISYLHQCDWTAWIHSYGNCKCQPLKYHWNWQTIVYSTGWCKCTCSTTYPLRSSTVMTWSPVLSNLLKASFMISLRALLMGGWRTRVKTEYHGVHVPWWFSIRFWVGGRSFGDGGERKQNSRQSCKFLKKYNWNLGLLQCISSILEQKLECLDRKKTLLNFYSVTAHQYPTTSTRVISKEK